VTDIELRTASEAEAALLVAIDDDACTLYAEAGMHFAFGADHPFALSEHARWRAGAAAGRVTLAIVDGAVVGFAAMATLDGDPYLDQLSVRRAHMRRGVGARLLAHAILQSGDAPLWLTTYGHLSWNAPWYERAGFTLVPDAEWRAGIRHDVEQQRAVLPAPEKRVVMVRRA
jgi:GNAT superfamily N-acetyltransferase